MALALVIAASAGPTAALADTAPAPAAGAGAPTFAAGYLKGVSGPQGTKTVDLAGTWAFTPLTNTTCTGGGDFGTTTGPLTCVNSPASRRQTTIQVPGGGWHKQGWLKLSRATYSRTITVPKVGGEQVTRLDFGAVNHRATLKVDGRTVATQTTSYTSSVFDLSDVVRPGSTHRIDVTVEGRQALVGPDGRYTVPEGASWSDDVAQGIFRSATLEVLPAVNIADTFVRPSVSTKTLAYDVSVSNNTARAQVVRLDGDLSSTSSVRWPYPRIPGQTVVVAPHSTTTATVGPLPWLAGAPSYWLPNVPYSAGYKSQLHDLRVHLTARPQSGSGASSTSDYLARFGFRELKQVGDHYELNGVPVDFRGDSLQGANYDNIDNHGVGDAYDTLPGFLKPSAGNGGWPQAVRNYQRLNYNTVRIHQVPATPYMLDVADELGLMILDETAIRGSNNRENFEAGRDNMVSHLADLVKRDRNHAAVLRWSQANEPFVPFFTNPGAGPAFDELLYSTVKSLDPTRPVSTDGNSTDLPHDDYTVFCHYDGYSFGKYSDSICAGPTGKPQGQGEFLWYADSTPQGFTWFGTATMQMRQQGADEIRPYTLLDGWASVIPGVKTTDMRLESGYPNGPHPIYGEDNLPRPWANPTLQLIQNAFNPVAAVDSDFWTANKLSDETGAWPVAPTTIAPGSNTRSVSVFNDTFSGTQLALRWTLHRGSTAGPAVASGSTSTQVALGTHAALPVTFTAPNTDAPLYLELTVDKPGSGTLFRDTSTVFQVRQS